MLFPCAYGSDLPTTPIIRAVLLLRVMRYKLQRQSYTVYLVEACCPNQSAVIQVRLLWHIHCSWKNRIWWKEHTPGFQGTKLAIFESSSAVVGRVCNILSSAAKIKQNKRVKWTARVPKWLNNTLCEFQVSMFIFHNAHKLQSLERHTIDIVFAFAFHFPSNFEWVSQQLFYVAP